MKDRLNLFSARVYYSLVYTQLEHNCLRCSFGLQHSYDRFITHAYLFTHPNGYFRVQTMPKYTNGKVSHFGLVSSTRFLSEPGASGGFSAPCAQSAPTERI